MSYYDINCLEFHSGTNPKCHFNLHQSGQEGGGRRENTFINIVVYIHEVSSDNLYQYILGVIPTSDWGRGKQFPITITGHELAYNHE